MYKAWKSPLHPHNSWKDEQTENSRTPFVSIKSEVTRKTSVPNIKYIGRQNRESQFDGAETRGTGSGIGKPEL